MLQCSLHPQNSNLHVFFYQQNDRIYYQIFVKEVMLFCGDQYKPSPLYQPFSLPSIIHLLDTLMPSPDECPPKSSNTEGDTQTQDRLDWYTIPEYANLYRYVSDYNHGDKRQKALAGIYFQQGFIEYIHPSVFNLYQVVGKKHYCPRRSWYTAAILLNHHQKYNLVKLLATDDLPKARTALYHAMEDNFAKVKNFQIFETILFEGDSVTLNPIDANVDLHTILVRLTKPYMKKVK